MHKLYGAIIIAKPNLITIYILCKNIFINKNIDINLHKKNQYIWELNTSEKKSREIGEKIIVIRIYLCIIVNIIIYLW